MTKDHESSLDSASISSVEFHDDVVDGRYDDDRRVKEMDSTISMTPEKVATTEEEELTREQERWVSRSRRLVVVVFVCAAIVAGFFTHRLASNSQQEEFEKEYHDFAVEILAESHHRVHDVLKTMEYLSTMITTLTLTMDEGVRWPFVILPHFQVWAGSVLNNSVAKPLAAAESEAAATTTTFDGVGDEISNNPLLLQLQLGVFVSDRERKLWNEYSLSNSHVWVQEDELSELGSNVTNATRISANQEQNQSVATTHVPIFHQIWKHGADSSGYLIRVPDLGPASEYAVSWQSTPVQTESVNHNDFESPSMAHALDNMRRHRQAVFTEVACSSYCSASQDNDKNILLQVLPTREPHSLLLQPVFDALEGDAEFGNVVGYLKATLPWENYFQNLLQEDTEAILVVLTYPCNDLFLTFELHGPDSTFLGKGDLHDPKFEDMAITLDGPDTLFAGSAGEELPCSYVVTIYPSEELRQSYQNHEPLLYTIIAFFVVFCAAMAFTIYDCFVQRRLQKVSRSALRSNAIVNSLFPENVRGRLLDKDGPGSVEFAGPRVTPVNSTCGDEVSVVSMVSAGAASSAPVLKTKPIADLFPNTTVMFADMVGFTAWSSVRDPTQVFTLLETLYNCFDRVAKRRKVFKVETIGDCYMAVAGLPEPRDDHALVMAKFAHECLVRGRDVFRELELLLGPDTADLSMRFGLHSGPVTAGVLRGEKSRFQLFGDTVNTAARMESTGAKNQIHLSQDTAELIKTAGKSSWVRLRETMVTAKGKGRLQTYWLELASPPPPENCPTGSVVTCGGISPKFSVNDVQRIDESTTRTGVKSIVAKFEQKHKLNGLGERSRRLVDFNVEVLHRLLKKIVAIRECRSSEASSAQESKEKFQKLQICQSVDVLDEVREIVDFPSKALEYKRDPNQVILSRRTMSQLTDYVTAIVSMYHDNHFHCFEHANHVTMSVSKLLSRLVTSDSMEYTNMKHKMKTGASGGSTSSHQDSFGIGADPLAQFALVFSALIHDVDHPGIPNTQLCKEKDEMALTYRNKSVAEQNSVDVAWNLLMESSYEELRMCIYTSQEELDRFRQLVVNAVMATDIMDKDMRDLRGQRWEKAFNSKDTKPECSPQEMANRKTTMVMEHLIQAADVAHTMQHWHVYLKWNQKLFQEMHKAFKEGRSNDDPSNSWYKSELDFFDNFVIPLARKLKECGVFGVTGEECLNYALANRRDWERKGVDVMLDYTDKRPVRQRRPSMGMTSSIHSVDSNFQLNRGNRL